MRCCNTASDLALETGTSRRSRELSQRTPGRDHRRRNASHSAGRRDRAAFQLAMVWTAFPRGAFMSSQLPRRVESAESSGGGRDRGALLCWAGLGRIDVAIANSSSNHAVHLDQQSIRGTRHAGFHSARRVWADSGDASSVARRSRPLGSPIATESLINFHGLRCGLSGSMFMLRWCRWIGMATVVRSSLASIRADLIAVLVRCGDVTVRGVHRSYGDVEVGKTLALFGQPRRAGNCCARWQRGADRGSCRAGI